MVRWCKITMLSDEEKKAIDKLKRSANYFVMPIYETKIILELIEKQSKEIEDLKKKPTFLIKDIFSSKIKEISLQDAEGLIEQGREEVRDKIKAKIEEYDDEINQLRIDRNVTFDSLIYRNSIKKDALQSLLEKE